MRPMPRCTLRRQAQRVERDPRVADENPVTEIQWIADETAPDHGWVGEKLAVDPGLPSGGNQDARPKNRQERPCTGKAGFRPHQCKASTNRRKPNGRLEISSFCAAQYDVRPLLGGKGQYQACDEFPGTTEWRVVRRHRICDGLLDIERKRRCECGEHPRQRLLP